MIGDSDDHSSLSSQFSQDHRHFNPPILIGSFHGIFQHVNKHLPDLVEICLNGWKIPLHLFSEYGCFDFLLSFPTAAGSYRVRPASETSLF